MDANGLRFWLLSDESHWAALRDLEYDRNRRSLRLADRRLTPDWPDDAAAATLRLDRVPSSVDAFGTRARWDAGRHAVVATGAVSGDVDIFAPSAEDDVTDVAVGHDGVLYIAVSGRVVLRDLRNRWEPVTLSQTGFAAWRLAPDPSGGTWAVDRETGALARVTGTPLATRPFAVRDPGVARPCDESPDPPRLSVLAEAVVPPDETPVAIACGPSGRLALLTWVAEGDARVRLLSEDQWGDPQTLIGVRHPYSVAWLSPRRMSVLVPDLGEAPTFALATEGNEAAPVGDYYPLRAHDGGPFLHGVSAPPHYPTDEGSSPLHGLSLPSFSPDGGSRNAVSIDSGSAKTEWHRLYVEAVLPPRTEIVVRLAATNQPAPPDDDRSWFEHRFGGGSPQNGNGAIPRGAWVSSASELPFHSGLLPCPIEKDRAGLFTVLIQRANRRVRTLTGRYLWMRVTLRGDGRSTPELAAIRAYASRFSYLNRYLPQLYRETLFGPEAADEGTSTPPDFLERFLGNLEGLLTPLEDRIASSYLLSDARTTPPEALDWLASWIGLTFEPGYSTSQQRRLLGSAAEVFQARGTLRGLRLALEIATDGAVSGGEVVVVEDFRLRRTFATILGADLADEDDPLLAGIVESGNSFVGDTLFLGDESKREFLALFGADLPTKPKEQAAIDDLFDRLAHRVTVLVHQEVSPQDLGLIRRVTAMETPAHVESRVITATAPFLIGMASIIGVDTYLGSADRPTPVRVGESHVGLRDVIQRPASLDPRLEGGT